ncbi:2-hydroxyacid dehydrogenase [[Mycoplasma] gypis]|uniref:2-hydroxyacid dehydrogenase n=1 Tax=[Mycoplasma] gypis TaxID=92404 RepID=A0ABZ2RNC1_9BACT|nr:2-hydroxyacid dehydrogenase [[Mycoplasma] gypis]MBN0919650.1 lactate dehydrogenase [[Mycoplasma] gypis]
MKVICFGVREVEAPIFERLNKDFNYELTLKSEALNEDNVEITKGFDAVICRASDKVNTNVLEKIKSYNIKYVLTRTAGFDHMDVNKGHDLGIQMARVPSYSPSAISEVAFTMALSLSRNIAHFSYKAKNYDFTFDSFGFSQEQKNSVVGIVGTGKIGFTTAKMFAGMNAKVLGYDPYPNENAKEILEYVSLDELLAKSDIVVFHMPYIKGQNDKFINKELISKMKDGAILINASRGQIQDQEALLEAVKSNKLRGIGIDVFWNEKTYLGKKLNEIEDDTFKQLLDLYPRVLVTPHIGSYTDEAVANMVEITYNNLKELCETCDCKNKI